MVAKRLSSWDFPMKITVWEFFLGSLTKIVDKKKSMKFTFLQAPVMVTKRKISFATMIPGYKVVIVGRGGLPGLMDRFELPACYHQNLGIF